MIHLILAVLAIGPGAMDGPVTPGFQAAPAAHAQAEPTGPAEPFYLSLQAPAGNDGRRIRPYLRGGGLFTFPFDADLGESVEFDYGYGLMAAVGVEGGGNTRFRGELQYMLRMANAGFGISSPFGGFVSGDVDLTLHSLLLNGQAVFYANGTASPYIGAGAGISHGVLEVELDGESEDDSDTVPELQVMGGMLFRIRENLSLDIGLSYTYAFHEIESSAGAEDADIDVVSASFGLTWRL